MRSALVALALLCALALPTEVGAMRASAGWYGNWQGKYRWYDPGDNNQPAYGPGNSIPGIATRTPGTRGHYYVVGFPNRARVFAIHSEYGPGGATGRNLDVNARLAEEAGYSPGNFPTGGGFQMWDLGPNLQVARRRAQALGARIPAVGRFGGVLAPGPRSAPSRASTAHLQPSSAPSDDGSLAALMVAALSSQPRTEVAPVTIPTPFFSTQARRYF